MSISVSFERNREQVVETSSVKIAAPVCRHARTGPTVQGAASQRPIANDTPRPTFAALPTGNGSGLFWSTGAAS